MAGSKNLAEDPYERLANAIILQAVTDYRSVLKKIRRNPKNKDSVDEALRIENARLKQENELLKMELYLRKKVKALERGDR